MMRLPRAFYSEDHEELLSWAREMGARLEARGSFRDRFRQAGELGLAGLGVPEEYGGAGLPARMSVAVVEALSESSDDTGFLFALCAHNFACALPIAVFGRREQREKWLPGLVGGSLIGAFAVTEPEAGSDAMAGRASAQHESDGWCLNGAKAMITNAPEADLVLVIAKTAQGRSFFASSGFLVPASTTGFEAGVSCEKPFMPSTPLGDLRLDDCRVALDAILGGEGAGGAVFSTAMAWERVCLHGLYLGQCRRALKEAQEYLAARKQFGRRLIDLQAVSHALAEAATGLEGARSLLFRAAAALDANSPDAVVLGDMAKIVVSRTAIEVGLVCTRLQGGAGLFGSTAQRLVRDALPAQVFSGSNDALLDNIVKSLEITRQSSRQEG